MFSFRYISYLRQPWNERGVELLELHNVMGTQDHWQSPLPSVAKNKFPGTQHEERAVAVIVKTEKLGTAEKQLFCNDGKEAMENNKWKKKAGSRGAPLCSSGVFSEVKNHGP